MSNKVIYWPHPAEPDAAHSTEPTTTKLMTDYAVTLKEKLKLENKNNILEVTNKSQVRQLEELQKELEQTKKRLKCNDHVIESLQQQLKTNFQYVQNEQDVYRSISEQREQTILDLRVELKDFKRKLAKADADLGKAKKQVEMHKERCKDYKDKLRGFAILFTYFNDPKHERESSRASHSLMDKTSQTQTSSIAKRRSSSMHKRSHAAQKQEEDRILSELFFKRQC